MDNRLLGRTGVRVSEFCLGTMTFGNEADEPASRAIVDRFVEAGGNFIDTADVYSAGASEEITGRAIAGRRDSIILATKGRIRMSGDVNDQGAGRRYLTKALDASLRRLGTDWIDLYQVHWPDLTVAMEETLSTLNDFVHAGKIRYAGVSNYLGWHLQKGIDLCERYGWAPISTHQPQYSLISREIELDSMQVCIANGIAVLPWSPLGGGVLTGKYRGADDAPVDTRLGDSEQQRQRRLSEHNLAVTAVVRTIAEELGRTPAQVALNWVAHRPGVTSPIIGARTVAQLEDNLGAVGWELDTVHAKSLDRVSRTPLPYPHDMYRMFA